MNTLIPGKVIWIELLSAFIEIRDHVTNSDFPRDEGDVGIRAKQLECIIGIWVA
jgi:hypothetical protein